MHINTVVNVDRCFDCEAVLNRLSEKYEEDARPYEICILGDLKGKRIQVRMDTGELVGELSMDISRGEVKTTDDLIGQISDRIELMLDELEN